MSRLPAILLLAILLLPFTSEAQVVFPNRGGTGTSTTPSTGQMLVGQSDGTYAPQATSTLGLSTVATFLDLTDTPGSYAAGSLLFTSGSAVTEDNASLFWDDSNDRLGIGTSTPASELHIEATSPTLTIDRAGGGSGNGDLQFELDDAFAGSFGMAGTANGVISGTAAGDIGLRSQQAIRFGTGGNNHRVTIDSNGNVGIGTTSPDAPLSVNGAVDFGGDLTSVNDKFLYDYNLNRLDIYERDDANIATRIDNTNFGGAWSLFRLGAEQIRLWATASYEFNMQNISSHDFIVHGNQDNMLYADSSANSIGIATGTPAFTLDVNGDFRVGEQGSSDAFFVDATSGEVSIGTTTPASRLHIYDPSATSTAFINSEGAGFGGEIILEDSDGAGCTSIAALNGVLDVQSVACPSP